LKMDTTRKKNLSILRNLILAGSIYFAAVAIVHQIGLKIPVFYIYFDVQSLEYQDRIISFLAFGWAVFFFSAYKLSIKNIEVVRYLIIAGTAGVIGLILNNIRTNFEVLSSNTNIWFYWIGTFALFLYLLGLIIYYKKYLEVMK